MATGPLFPDETAPAVMGRPPKYDPSYVKQVEKLCALGATNQEIADFFEVNVRTVDRWIVTHEDFCRAVKTAREVADDRVERSLYHRAVGYEQEAVKIFMPAGAVEPVYAKYREKVAPDATSMIFWLKNRKPDKWRDKSQQEITGKDGSDLMGERDIDSARLVAFLLGKAVGKQVADERTEAGEPA